ncbi:FHA domain-containing protein [bacterium]|nr:FHA domain-containing protein [bacterium]
MNRVVKAQKLKLALVVESGLSLGDIFPLCEKRQVIGRRMDAAIPVEDSKVSRDHAIVDYRNGFFYLVDLGSTNGTFVNGRKVQHAIRLNLGDHLRFGSSSFKVELMKKVQESTPKRWHEATNVDLRVFDHSPQASLQMGASSKINPDRLEAGEDLSIMDSDSGEINISSTPSARLGKALSNSIPRWLYLVDRDRAASPSKQQGLMLMILICSLLVLSAIFVGFDATASR